MLENIQGDSWGSIPPLRMPSLLPHDLCHEWNASPAPGRKPLDHSGVTWIRSFTIIQWKWQIHWRDWLDLIECLKNYEQRVVTLYRRQWSRLSPRKRNAKGKMVVWGGLTNSWEKERSDRQKRKGKIYPYTHISAEFQRTARRDKKAFPSDQCKEIEDNNRMGSLQEN